MSIKTVVTVLPLKEHHRRLLEEAAPTCRFYHLGPGVPEKEQIADADVIIGNVPPALLKEASHLQLMQLSSAGTDGYTAPGVLPEGAKLANASGAYGLAIAEHMMAAVLSLMKKLPLYQEDQKAHVWRDEGAVRSVYASRTLVVGMGDIGSEFARRMHAFGSTIVGVRRHTAEKPEWIEKLCTMEQLDEELSRADIVACSLPGTAETYHLFDEERVSKMKKGAIFVNVGRGTLIAPEVLSGALQSGRLGGAYVDVTEPEPLPEDSPLWDAPNLILTPHVSGGFHLEETLNRIVGIGAANLKAVGLGEPVLNEVDFATGYRKLENRRK